MGEYDSGPRPLPWDLRNALVFSQTVDEDDGGLLPSSFIWPEDSDERTLVSFMLSLNEFNTLASAIDIGSDIAYGADALRVTDLWMRSRIEADMSCCGAFLEQTGISVTNEVTTRAIQSQGLRDLYDARYDGSPTSINPDAPTTTFSYDASDDGTAALCAALMAYVYQAARAQADSVRAGQVVGLAAIGLIAGLLIPGLNIFFLAGAAIAVLLGLGTVGVTTEVAIAALTDTSALDAVVCCMKNNLKDAAVSESSWAGALGGCAFESGSHAQIVADFLGATLAANYLTFLDVMGTGYAGVTDGATVPDCPCQDEPVEIFAAVGLPGGSFVNHGGGSYTFASGLGGDGFNRVLFQYNSVDPERCIRFASIDISVTIAPGFSGWYTCGANPAENGYEDGAVAGALVAGSCWAGIGVTHTSAFTIDIQFEEDDCGDEGLGRAALPPPDLRMWGLHDK